MPARPCRSVSSYAERRSPPRRHAHRRRSPRRSARPPRYAAPRRPGRWRRAPRPLTEHIDDMAVYCCRVRLAATRSAASCTSACLTCRSPRLAAHEHDLRLHQPAEPWRSTASAIPGDGREQRIRKLAPQHRRALRDLLRAEVGRAVPSASRRVSPGLRPRRAPPRLDDRFGQLLDVERHAVGPCDQCLDRSSGSRLRRVRTIVRAVALGEARER